MCGFLAVTAGRQRLEEDTNVVPGGSTSLTTAVLEMVASRHAGRGWSTHSAFDLNRDAVEAGAKDDFAANLRLLQLGACTRTKNN